MTRTGRRMAVAFGLMAVSLMGAQPGLGNPLISDGVSHLVAVEWGPVSSADCALTALLARRAPGCTPLTLKAAWSSGAYESTAPRHAFDGNLCGGWNSGGFAPQTVSADLGGVAEVSALLLVPEMTPATGPVRHLIEVSPDYDHFRPVHEIRQTLKSGHAYLIKVPGGLSTRFFRVRTVSSPSWVAWNEVTPLRCGRVR